MLGEELKRFKCQVFHNQADADYLIVQKTVMLAEKISTVLIVNDTDLFVLLLYHTDLEKHDIFFVPETKGILNLEYEISRKQKKNLDHTSVSIYSFSMHFLDLTLLHVCMALVKVL